MLIDEIDEKIIALLQEDGRLSNRAVGRAINLSEGAIRKRIRRMVDGALISYRLLIDLHATGPKSHGWLSVETRPDRVRAVAEHIGDLEHCTLCAVMSGNLGVLAYIWEDDLDTLVATNEAISRVDGVTRVTFRQVVDIVKHRYELIVLSPADHPATWNPLSQTS